MNIEISVFIAEVSFAFFSVWSQQQQHQWPPRPTNFRITFMPSELGGLLTLKSTGPSASKIGKWSSNERLGETFRICHLSGNVTLDERKGGFSGVEENVEYAKLSWHDFIGMRKVIPEISTAKFGYIVDWLWFCGSLLVAHFSSSSSALPSFGSDLLATNLLHFIFFSSLISIMLICIQIVCFNIHQEQ